MRPISWSGTLLVFIGCWTFQFKTILGLKCYECIRGDDSEPSDPLCDDFEKADTTLKKSNFTENCVESATGCAFVKISIPSKNEAGEVISRSVSQGLECFDPETHMSSSAIMNQCVTSTDEDDIIDTICVCDTGDYCIQSEEEMSIVSDSSGGESLRMSFLVIVFFGVIGTFLF